jgi:two-component system sensor histidine kinase MprB
VIVEGAPERIGRAVNNLLDNASRHSPPGGRVEVTVDRTGVRVRDHGEGIPEQDLPHVFDRFFRGADTRGSQGSGLGLAIVRQVAEQHGGSVAAVNASDGGAVFSLRLPTVAASAAGAAVAASAASPAGTAGAAGGAAADGAGADGAAIDAGQPQRPAAEVPASP